MPSTHTRREVAPHASSRQPKQLSAYKKMTYRRWNWGWWAVINLVFSFDRHFGHFTHLLTSLLGSFIFRNSFVPAVAGYKLPKFNVHVVNWRDPRLVVKSRKLWVNCFTKADNPDFSSLQLCTCLTSPATNLNRVFFGITHVNSCLCIT